MSPPVDVPDSPVSFLDARMTHLSLTNLASSPTWSHALVECHTYCNGCFHRVFPNGIDLDQLKRRDITDMILARDMTGKEQTFVFLKAKAEVKWKLTNYFERMSCSWDLGIVDVNHRETSNVDNVKYLFQHLHFQILFIEINLDN